jgi:glycosyltransferase involved in cell wall biosynthesis
MKLSVLIPAYNEAPSVREVVERVAAVDIQKEIIVVDDASTDGTRTVLNGLQVEGLRVIGHPTNRGKGAAIRTALASARGEAVIIQDADLEYWPEDYPRLMAPIASGAADVVYGVRDLSTQPLMRRLGNRFLTALTNLLYGSHLRDMETCYKMMTLRAARSFELTASGFDLEPEITARLLRRGYRIHEVDIRYAPRREAKLSPLRDGPRALWTLLKLRWTDRGPSGLSA